MVNFINNEQYELSAAERFMVVNANASAMCGGNKLAE